MTQATHAGLGLVRLGDSGFVLVNPEDDARGKDVYDAQGQLIGGVDDLYIDRQEREVRLLEVGVEGTADRPGGIRSSFSYDRHPY